MNDRMVTFVYAHHGIRWDDRESQVMMRVINEVIDHPKVRQVVLAEFGKDLYQLTDHPKLRRFQINYDGPWCAGLMRNVGLGCADVSPAEICIFADTDVLLTHKAVDAAIGILQDDGVPRLLQFPRSDMGEIVTRGVLRGELTWDNVRNCPYHQWDHPQGVWFDKICKNKGEQAILKRDIDYIGGWSCVITGWGGYDVDFNWMAEALGFEITAYGGRESFHFHHQTRSKEDAENNKRNVAYSKEKIRRMRSGQV